MGGDKFQRQVEFFSFFPSWGCLYSDWLSCISRKKYAVALNIYPELFCLQGAAKPSKFLAVQWRMGGDKFQGQLSFFWSCLLCGRKKKCLWVHNCSEYFVTALIQLFHQRNLSCSRPVQCVCFLWGQKSYAGCCISYFLPAGELILLPYLWYCNSWLYIPPILLHHLYLLNVSGYKYPAHILSNPIPATESTNTWGCTGSEMLLWLSMKLSDSLNCVS